MNSQVKSQFKNPFNILYSKLPETIILIIFEFEGLAKENNDNFIQKEPNWLFNESKLNKRISHSPLCFLKKIR